MTEREGVYPPGRSCATEAAEPVVVVSDVHLNLSGRWRDRLDAFRMIWSGARTVVLNGDTLDWFAASHSASEEILTYLRRMCKCDDVRPVLLGGNSDGNIAQHRYAVLGGGRILVTHGDAIFPSVSPWRSRSREIFAAREQILQRMAADRRATLEGQLESAHGAMRILRDKYAAEWKLGPESRILREQARWRENLAGILAILQTWRVAPKMAARFAAEFAPWASFVIMGHTHRPGIWHLEGKTIVNTGGYGRMTRPLAAWVGHGKLKIHEITRRNRTYTLGKLTACYELAGRRWRSSGKRLQESKV